MKNLTFANFKAFGQEPVVFGGETSDGKPMNILCYGENGAGKSSVYEVIKYVFHKDRIESDKVSDYLVGQARANALQQILIDYQNKRTASPISISVNGQPLGNFDASNYYVYMIDSGNLIVNDSIEVVALLKSMYLGRHNIEEELTPVFFDAIIEETNKALKEYFFEDIVVSKSNNGAYRLRINDEGQDLHFDDDLRTHFNEAKLHLVQLLTILSSIELMAPASEDAKKMLVLDDFITSLDTANRSFLYQYITSKFKSFQIIIFTHNTSFYNLCDHFIKETPAMDARWLRQGIFEYNRNHYVYSKVNKDRIKELEEELKMHPERVMDIGNSVRQYFEVLLHRLSLMLMAGAKEETVHVLGEISKKTDTRVFHIDEHGMHDLRELFQKIMSIMDNAPEDEQWEKIKAEIDRFRNADNTADKLSENLQAMTIYQKVALHQSSHGHEGLPNLGAKEIKASLVVLKKLEDTIKKMKIERI